MKKSLIKILFLCGIIAILVIWNGIYMDYFFPDSIRCQPECSMVNLLTFIPLGVKEELIFRYLPFVLVTSVYIGLKKMGVRRTKMLIIPLGIFVIVVQFVFSSLHLPLDPIYREALYDLPPYPTFKELFDTFLLQGILGISLCSCYLLYISKEKPLYLLQGECLLASCFVHIVHNQLIVILYGKNPPKYWRILC